MATVELDGLLNDSIFVVHDENLIATHSTHIAIKTLGGQACCGIVLQHTTNIQKSFHVSLNAHQFMTLIRPHPQQQDWEGQR